MTENTKDSGKQPSPIHDRAADGVTISPRAELLKRTSKASTWLPALAEVQLKLAVSTQLYETLPDKGRLGTIGAVEAAIDYFISFGIPRAALQPLINITVALSEANEGIHNPTFEVKKSGNRGPRGNQNDRALKGVLAGVTKCCILHLEERVRPFRAPAGRLAEKMVRESALELAVYPTAAQLLKWCERVSEMDQDTVERAAFDRVVSIPKGVDALECAKVLLSTPWGRPV